MFPMIRLTGVAMIAILGSVVMRAQESLSPDTVGVETVRTDSTSLIKGVPARMVTAASVDTLPPEFHPRKSPALAMLFSAILPGAGQAYAESYWKVPVILGFGIYFASEWLSANRNYVDYRNRYRASPHTDTEFDNILIGRRDAYRSIRDDFTWYFFILYVINIADAYVDASLYDFNVSPDLSIRVMPVPGQGAVRAPSVGIRIRW